MFGRKKRDAAPATIGTAEVEITPPSVTWDETWGPEVSERIQRAVEDVLRERREPLRGQGDPGARVIAGDGYRGTVQADGTFRGEAVDDAAFGRAVNHAYGFMVGETESALVDAFAVPLDDVVAADPTPVGTVQAAPGIWGRKSLPPQSALDNLLGLVEDQLEKTYQPLAEDAAAQQALSNIAASLDMPPHSAEDFPPLPPKRCEDCGVVHVWRDGDAVPPFAEGGLLDLPEHPIIQDDAAARLDQEDREAFRRAVEDDIVLTERTAGIHRPLVRCRCRLCAGFVTTREETEECALPTKSEIVSTLGLLKREYGGAVRENARINTLRELFLANRRLFTRFENEAMSDIRATAKNVSDELAEERLKKAEKKAYIQGKKHGSIAGFAAGKRVAEEEAEGGEYLRALDSIGDSLVATAGEKGLAALVERYGDLNAAILEVLYVEARDLDALTENGLSDSHRVLLWATPDSLAKLRIEGFYGSYPAAVIHAVVASVVDRVMDGTYISPADEAKRAATQAETIETMRGTISALDSRVAAYSRQKQLAEQHSDATFAQLTRANDRIVNLSSQVLSLEAHIGSLEAERPLRMNDVVVTLPEPSRFDAYRDNNEQKPETD